MATDITQGYYRDESEIPNGWVPLSGYDSGVRTTNGRTPGKEYKLLWDATEQERLSCLQKFTGLGKKGGRKYVPRQEADALLAEYACDIEADASLDDGEDFVNSDASPVSLDGDGIARLSLAIEDLTLAVRQAVAAISRNIN
jgi:hypothetical protein